MSSIEALPATDISTVQVANKAEIAVASNDKTKRNQSFSQVFSKTVKRKDSLEKNQPRNPSEPSTQNSNESIHPNNPHNREKSTEKSITRPQTADASTPKHGTVLPLFQTENLAHSDSGTANQVNGLPRNAMLDSQIPPPPQANPLLNAHSELPPLSANSDAESSGSPSLLDANGHHRVLMQSDAQNTMLVMQESSAKNAHLLLGNDKQAKSQLTAQSSHNIHISRLNPEILTLQGEAVKNSILPQSGLGSSQAGHSSAVPLHLPSTPSLLRNNGVEQLRHGFGFPASSLAQSNTSVQGLTESPLGLPEQVADKTLGHHLLSQTKFNQDNQQQSLITKDQFLGGAAREYGQMLQQQLNGGGVPAMEQSGARTNHASLLQFSQLIDDVQMSDANHNLARESQIANRISTNTSISSNPSLQLTASLNNPDWSKEVGHRVLWLANKEIQQAQLQLNPKHLGPMEVRISVNQDQQVSVNFITQSHLVKEALDGAVPRLREMFDQQGLNLSDLDISQESYKQKQQHDRQSPSNQAGNSELAENVHEDSVDKISNTISKEHDVGVGIVDYYA